MSEHTPGRLHVGSHYRTDVESREGRVAECRMGTSRGEANAAHIVACVNACEGINPEAVPELLEAAKGIEKALKNATLYLSRPQVMALCAAIAKAEAR